MKNYRSIFDVLKAFAIMALIVTLAGELTAKEYEFDEKRVFAVESGSTLELNYFGGNLTLASHESDRIVIKVVKRIDAVSMDEAKYIADNVVIKADQTREILVINASFLQKIKKSNSLWGRLIGSSSGDPYGSVDFEVLVPRECSVTVSNNIGNIQMSDLTGTVMIRSSASDIELSSIEGNVTINNAGGQTVGSLIIGDVVIDQPMGSIDLQYIEGDIRLKSNSAAVNIVQERGSLDLTTTTGDVSIKSHVYTGRDCFVTTESGNINLSLPQSLSGTLELKSDLGNIKTQMPVVIESVSKDRLVGNLGAGGVRISLSSNTGDVTVAEF